MQVVQDGTAVDAIIMWALSFPVDISAEQK